MPGGDELVEVQEQGTGGGTQFVIAQTVDAVLGGLVELSVGVVAVGVGAKGFEVGLCVVAAGEAEYGVVVGEVVAFEKHAGAVY